MGDIRDMYSREVPSQPEDVIREAVCCAVELGQKIDLREDDAALIDINIERLEQLHPVDADMSDQIEETMKALKLLRAHER